MCLPAEAEVEEQALRHQPVLVVTAPIMEAEVEAEAPPLIVSTLVLGVTVDPVSSLCLHITDLS